MAWDKVYLKEKEKETPEPQCHEDESERGRALVSSASGWRTEMAKWIAEAREAEREESDDDEVSRMIDNVRKRYGSGNQFHLPCFSGARSRCGQDFPRKRLMQSHG